jgi:hypothetical protein
MEDKRFEIIYTQETFNNFRIILDTKTGVQYLHVANGNGRINPLARPRRKTGRRAYISTGLNGEYDALPCI